MKITKLAGVLAATAVAVGIGAGTAAPASAADNIKIFGEQERLNGMNGRPYIGYTVDKFGPSKDPVPHNGKLFSANLKVDTFGGSAPLMIERFGARALNGAYFPVISGASNPTKLYFDVVGPDVPNSVVWSDGIRDILAWVPGKLPLEPKPKYTSAPPPPAAPPKPPPPAPYVAPPAGAMPAGAMPAETDAAIVATPNQLAAPPYQLTPAEVAQPGFRG